MAGNIDHKHKITSLSKILYYVSTILLIILPIFTCLIWFKLEWFHGALRDEYDVMTFNIRTQAIGLLFSLFPLFFWLYGIMNLRRLFHNYMKGNVFISDNARYIKKFAGVNICIGLMMPFIGGIFSVILSMNHPVGERILSIQLGTIEIHTVLLGFVFMVIAHVMDIGHQLAEENSKFI